MKETIMKYNSLKIRSTRWPYGHLRANFYVSTELAGKIIELVALNPSHVTEKLPDMPRDELGHFTKVNDLPKTSPDTR